MLNGESMKLFNTRTTYDGHKKIYFCGIKLGSFRPRKSIQLFRQMGVKIGEWTSFIAPPNFGSKPFLIEIGNNCVVSFGVTFLTHDTAFIACQPYLENKNTVKFGRIKISDECFIVCNVTILLNVEVGKNSIIGAGSVLTKNVPSGEVWAGNPAKFICETVDLAKKIENNSKTIEQVELYDDYNKIKKQKPCDI